MEKVRRTGKSDITQKRVARILLIPNFLVLFWLVWTPNPSENCRTETLNATEVFCLPTFWGWVGNLMLLMPTAFLLYIVLGKIRVGGIALLLVALPVVIEGVQSFIPGRDPDIRDFLTNSLGGLSSLYLLSRRLSSITS